MTKAGNKSQNVGEASSLEQWMTNYSITIKRDKEYSKIAEDPDRFGITLANSTFDRFLKRKKSHST